jgi:hypothetical protein
MWQATKIPATAAAAAAPTPDALWWKFNEGTGTNIAASVGTNGITDAAWVTGSSGTGYALSPSVTTTGASIGTVSLGVEKLTVCFWMFITNTTTAIYILELHPPYNNYNDGFRIYFSSANISMGSQIYGTLLESFARPTQDAWHHYAAVFDASVTGGEEKLYIDGNNQTNSVTPTKSLPAGFYPFGSNSIKLGGFGNYHIDDLRIYKSELTESEIIAIKNDPQ